MNSNQCDSKDFTRGTIAKNRKTEKFTAQGRDLKAMFEPRTVAVIGASRRKETVGYAILNNLIQAGFKGAIYPVNPKADSIDGVRCYASIQEVTVPIDLAVVIVPSASAVEVLESCGEKGVKAVIIISAGFREVGEEGAKRENQVREISRRYNMPVLGPNCLGLINTDPIISMNASFSRTMPRPGNIAFLSQSGALCTAILDYAKAENIGFSKFISFGNKADINELDLLSYLKDDSKTDLIMMYVEDLVDGRGFIQLAREITGDAPRPKPILVIKAGRTAQGAKAAQSHTGSMMGSDEIYDATFAQSGVIRVNSVEEIFDLAVAFANQPLPKSKRVAIITNAGGPGIMTTDACVRYGLDIAQFESSTIEALKKVLPPTANFSNPVDVIGDAQHDRYENALKIVLNDPNVDSVIVVLTPQAMTDIEEIAKVIVTISKETQKTILTCFMGFVDVAFGVKILEDNHVPNYPYPEGPPRALAAMCRYKQWVERPRTSVRLFPVKPSQARSVLKEAVDKKQLLLTIDRAMEVLRAYGFPVLPCSLATTETEAASQTKKIGFPLAMKIVSDQISHKFDVGGVRLHLKSTEDVTQAFREMKEKVSKQMSNAQIRGVFLQAMSKPGKEVIIGMKRDPHFGPIVMFGMGGVYVETIRDVIFRVAPIRELGARRMVESVRSFPILKGVRGEKPADINAIVECLQRLSQLSCDEPSIVEIDINPLMVHPEGDGASVIDARIVVDPAFKEKK
ncbi:MAG: acetate--CoA ligase [Candidatus Omnitrophica bacterium]|nr:acetate--CoA ligase [Candidatus Omnitrophota bacterium]